MRGTLFPKIKRVGDNRFIPADAGNIEIYGEGIIKLPVHPRGCGEHVTFLIVTPKPAGSSPRMRGTYYFALLRHLRCRFIPADAGNITTTKRKKRGLPVHPRGCGEHGWSNTSNVSSAGSSPRMRGTFAAAMNQHCLLRFIPADAGNIQGQVGWNKHSSVHPRGCGEHFIKI